jgi:hypothetical protein
VSEVIYYAGKLANKDAGKSAIKNVAFPGSNIINFKEQKLI